MDVFNFDTIGGGVDGVTADWSAADWGIAAGAGVLAVVVSLIALVQLASLARRVMASVAAWPSARWIMAAVGVVAIALTVLSIHGIQAALTKMGITTWYGKLSSVVAFEVFLGLCAYLAYRQRTQTEGGSGPYGLMVWVLAGLMGAAGAWGGGSWLYVAFPVLAAVAWEFALHAQVAWTRRLDTDKAKSWWADTKANIRAKLDLRNRRVKKLVAASLALESANERRVQRAIGRQKSCMASLMTAGDWTDTTKDEIKTRIRDLAAASLELSPAALTADITTATAGTNGGTNGGTNRGTVAGTNGGTNRGTVTELTAELTGELSPELTAELKAIFDADNSGTNGGTNGGSKGGSARGTKPGTNGGTKTKARRPGRQKKRAKRGEKKAAIKAQLQAGLTDPAAIVEALAVDGVNVTPRHVRDVISTWNNEEGRQ